MSKNCNVRSHLMLRTLWLLTLHRGQSTQNNNFRQTQLKLPIQILQEIHYLFGQHHRGSGRGSSLTRAQSEVIFKFLTAVANLGHLIFFIVRTNIAHHIF